MTHPSADTAEPPIRQGAPWTSEDYETLIDELLDGSDEVEVSYRLGRTPGGVRSRARFLLDPDARKPGKNLTTLRELLEEDPDYDWESRVRAASTEVGGRFWSRDDVALLRNAWTAQQPLPTLANALGATEQQVIRQLLALGIATSTVNAVDRLGATPGGVVDLRARLATDRENTSVWILTITGLLTTPNHHVSLHPTREEAVQARSKIVDDIESASRGTGATTLTWTIAQRTPGSENAGDSSSGRQTVTI